MKSSKHLRGVSLIELMVALAIGSVLMLGLVQVFGGSRTAYQMSEGMARVQESARFAMDYIQRDLRMAGHFGCINDQAHLQSVNALQSHFAGANEVGHPLNFQVSVHGYNAPETGPGDSLKLGDPSWPATPLPPSLSGLDVLPGSDVLVLRYLSPLGAPVTDIQEVTGTEVLTLESGRGGVLTEGGVTAPSLFGIADCSFADIFHGIPSGSPSPTSVTVAPVSASTANLRGRYTPQPSGQTMLYRAESLVYYVADNPAGVPALYRARHNGAAFVPEELVEGVESLQLLFGFDRETDLINNPPSGYIDHYAVTAPGSGTEVDWRRAGVVQVGLLVRSPNAAASGQALDGRTVLGVNFTAPDNNDGLFRAGYETTIALRNRLYGN